MIWLALVSLVWAFSFGLIKGQLTGVDSAFVSAVRLLLALLVFLPFFRPRAAPAGLALQLVAVGALQFGVMYLCLIEGFRYLKAYEVALLTVFTPFLVWGLADVLERRFRPRFLAAAALSVAGAAVVTRWDWTSETVTGVALILASNCAFAAGQVLYARLQNLRPGGAGTGFSQAAQFGWLYLGSVLVTVPVALARADVASLALHLTSEQWLVLGYLGVIASGLCFFGWNLGATRVNSGLLAAWNNAKAPLGVLVSVFIFGESADPVRLAAGVGLVGLALWWGHRAREHPPGK